MCHTDSITIHLFKLEPVVVIIIGRECEDFTGIHLDECIRESVFSRIWTFKVFHFQFCTIKGFLNGPVG